MNIFIMVAANIAAFAYACVTGDITIVVITMIWLWSVYWKDIYKAWYKSIIRNKDMT